MKLSLGRTEFVYNQISDSIRGASDLRMNQALPENSSASLELSIFVINIIKYLLLSIHAFFCNIFYGLLVAISCIRLFLAMQGHHVSVASLLLCIRLLVNCRPLSKDHMMVEAIQPKQRQKD